MYTGKQFRLTSPTLGIEDLNGHRTAVMVPAEEILRVLSGPCPDDHRLVDVQWGIRHLVMFTEDIETRGDQVRSVNV